VAFQRATELKPDWAEAHLQLGLTHENLGDHEKSLASIKEANRLKPDDLTILNT
jgi:tetratricopeptide (TPR) repeat protein